MKKFLILIVAMFILSSCSVDTPNNVAMSLSQGTCAPSSWVAGNPSVAPYCMAVTLQNNNSGYNANNVQIITSGMVLAYTANGTSYSGIMCDPNAASGTNCSTAGAVQTLGNVTIYDPNNCATTQGSNVTTLSQGGGSCTFYLQLSGESYPVGVYGTSLTYNYTNGNTNYSISTNFNQRVNLFAGGSFSGTLSGLAFYNGSGGAFQAVSPSYAGTTVNAITEDEYGNIYVGTLGGSVYLYNGGTSWVGLPSSGAVIATGVNNINSLISDESSNVYAATNDGVYKLAFESTTWTALPTVIAPTMVGSIGASPIVGLQIDTLDNIYAIESTGAIHRCSLSSCTSWTLMYTPSLSNSVFNNAFLLTSSAMPFVGTTTGLYYYSGSSWAQNTGGYVGSITGLQESSSAIYVTANSGTTESAIYNSANATGTGLTVQNSGESNTVYGNAYSVVLDSGNNLFIGGNVLTSLDFASGTSSALAAYLALSPAAGVVTTWTPLTGLLGGQINTMSTSSQLTSY